MEQISSLKLSKTPLVAIIDFEDERLVKTMSSVWYYHSERGYVFTNVSKKNIMLHRLIMGSPEASKDVDHINGNKLDNRKCNLRVVTRSENCRNRHRRKKTGSSQYFGVSKIERNNEIIWTANLCFSFGRIINLGRYEDEIDAARAYNIAAKDEYGDYSNFNDVPEPYKEPMQIISQGKKNRNIYRDAYKNSWFIKFYRNGKNYYAGHWRNVEIAIKIRDEARRQMQYGAHPKDALERALGKHGEVSDMGNRIV